MWTWLRRYFSRRRTQSLLVALPDEQISASAFEQRTNLQRRFFVTLERPVLPNMNIYNGPVSGRARWVFERVTPEPGEVIRLLDGEVERGRKEGAPRG
jgi:hypothetical protein